MVVFYLQLIYNCQIMSADSKGEQPLGAQIDAIFQTSYGDSLRGRIELAAHALSSFVGHLDYLQEQQRLTHENVGSASRWDISLHVLGYTALFMPVVPAEVNTSEKTDLDRFVELFEDDNDKVTASIFTPIQKAKLALSASTDGVRAAHNLSRWQANRAIALSRKKLQ